MHYLIISLFFQRPTAKELIRHPFIKKAKRNNHLMDLIDRYKKWRLTHSNESDSESESDSDQQNNSDDSDWNMTVKGSTTPYIEQLNDNDNSLDNNRIEVVHNNVNNVMTSSQQLNGENAGALTGQRSPVKETQAENFRQNSRQSPVKEQRSPVKEQVDHHRRSTSPQKPSSPSKESPSRSLAHSGGVAKSDLNIVSICIID